MRIQDLLKVEAIQLGVSAENKEAAIDTLVALHDKVGNLADVAEYKAAILKRESESTTAIGEGLAVPHAKTAAAKQPGLAAITVPDGVDYDAPDGQPATLCFMIAAPEGAGDAHLEILSRLMVMRMDPDFGTALRGAKTPEEFLDSINKQEAAKYPEDVAPVAEQAPEDESKKKVAAVTATAAAGAAAAAAAVGPKVVAVTACPTGIAHTYMAAEALEKKAEEMGVPIKVETNGSGGAKNVLTAEEIAGADGVIIAADKNVEMARFDGKHLVKVPVADGIHKPEELINKATSGEAPVYKAEAGASTAEEAVDDESTWRKVYKHLMNGVSHMLPFVVGGGILIALAFLVDTIYCAQHGLAYGSDFGTMTPVSAWLKLVGGYAFNFMLPVLAGFIAMSIADRPGLAVGFVGGWLANLGVTWKYLALAGNDDAFAEATGHGLVSAGFLGALLAGFLAGYIVNWLKKLTAKFPPALDGIRPMLIYPLLGIALIAAVMCTINPVMAAINTGISTFLNFLYGKNLIALLGLLLGAMMAADMGGPINKAAYLFGTGMLTLGTDAGYLMMACVMIGGMVPPIAIAMACQFFPQKFTKQERSTVATNYVMGLSFITEGAIPFAASDPAHVIPAMMVGSGVAGALSALFKCTLMAPHGGIFVFATVGRWYFYLLALAAGALAGMAMLGLLKKDVVSKEEIAAEKAAAKEAKKA
ncbi:MAG: PTS sugar transporter subunit IIA [Clostridia bacterium]|nr:PTS sugar transporter subunit IIA [Clostridia bacterium]